MGQAKQRANKFGKQVRSVLKYRTTPFFLAWAGRPEALEVAMLEIGFLRTVAGFHRPAPVAFDFDAVRELLAGMDVAKGSVVLLDVDTLALSATLQEGDFEARYQQIAGFENVVCLRIGDTVEVGIDEKGDFRLEGGGEIDPLTFFLDKASVTNHAIMPASLPFSVQVVGHLMNAMQGGDPPQPELIGHMIAHQKALSPSVADMPMAIHADFMIVFRIGTGEEVFDEDNDSGHPMIAMMDMLERLETDLELPQVLADYCRNEGEGNWILRPRHLDDERIWQDFENEALGLSANLDSEIRIGEEAWRGSFSIDMALQAGKQEDIDSFYKFFDRGVVVHHLDLPQGMRIDVIDIDDVRFIVKTIPRQFAEVVAWLKGDASIDAATPILEGEDDAAWSAYRFVPPDMTRPEMMRLQIVDNVQMKPSLVRQLVSNLHGFDSWRALEAAVIAGPATPADEDVTATEVEERRRMAVERSTEKCLFPREFVEDMFAQLRPTSRKGTPSLKNLSDGPRLFPGVQEEDIEEILRDTMDSMGLERGDGSIEDEMRSSLPVFPSAWVGVLEDFGWRIENVDLEDDGVIIGPDYTQFGEVETKIGRAGLYLVPFLTFPDDNGDELLDSIMEELESPDEPVFLFQNKVLLAEQGDKQFLYGGRAWDGREWWQFLIGPGQGPNEVIAQRGKDVELLGRRARSHAFAGAKERGIALQLALMGTTGDAKQVSFINHKSGWQQPFVMTDDMAGMIGKLKGSAQ